MHMRGQRRPLRPRPRLGFLGVGWIGRNRLEALAQSGLVEIAAVSDPVAANVSAAQDLSACTVANSLDELLDGDLDGVVIATPSALHATQAAAALERGVAVFCQKPLGRTAAETAQVVDAARVADRLLGVDLSYRFVEGVRRIRELIQAGELGSIYAADLIFHNAYGPDKPWFYDPALSGGGCVIDLGIHLMDLALWTLEPQRVIGVTSRLYAKGKALGDDPGVVEDYAIAELHLENGAAARLACSWNLPAGCDAVIQASFFGTRGGATLSNVGGSFFDFTAERFRGTARERLCSPPDAWGGRAAVDWATRLAKGSGFDPAAERLIELAALIDTIYGRSRIADERPPAYRLVDRDPVLVAGEAGPR
jgi:predicted dehydrogenase